MNTPLLLLNNLTPSQFLAEYWQKKPLLIKNAIPNFEGLLSPEELAGLACEDDVQSRIVEYIKGEWHAHHGPFDDDDFAKLPEKPSKEHNWTLLVQSVNHYLPEASALLQQFDFIPHARLDDLMVSYAPDGGGVGGLHFSRRAVENPARQLRPGLHREQHLQGGLGFRVRVRVYT